MPFLKKAEVTRKKIDGLAEKDLSLQDDLEKISKKIEKRKDEISTLLGRQALAEGRQEDIKDLDTLKVRLAKAIEEQADIQTMLTMVRQERQKLAVALDECVIAESPEEMEAVASKFNQKLDDTLKTLGALEADFVELQGLESNFISLSNRRKNSLSKLGRLDGLELSESLGRLALTPSPYGFVFSCSGQLQYFVANLLAYRAKLEDYEKFKADNPNYFENVKTTQEGQKEKPWQKMLDWNWLRQ